MSDILRTLPYYFYISDNNGDRIDVRILKNESYGKSTDQLRLNKLEIKYTNNVKLK